MKTKLTNGNTLHVDRLGATTRVAVTDAGGEVVASHDATDLDPDLVDVLEAAAFRLVRTCDVCGARFRAKRATARHCSAKCKTRAYRTRQQAADAPAAVDAGEGVERVRSLAHVLGLRVNDGRGS